MQPGFFTADQFCQFNPKIVVTKLFKRSSSKSKTRYVKRLFLFHLLVNTTAARSKHAKLQENGINSIFIVPYGSTAQFFFSSALSEIFQYNNFPKLIPIGKFLKAERKWSENRDQTRQHEHMLGLLAHSPVPGVPSG